MSVVDDLHRARQAYERREWVSAYRTLSGVDESALTAGDFVALATTAYLLGQRNDCVQATQRAYKAKASTTATFSAPSAPRFGSPSCSSRAARVRSGAAGWQGLSGS
jgi:hypothetical protein